MHKIIRKKDRHFTDLQWLRTYWLFSFSDYYDRENVEFGNLRVFNDDVIAPHSGFPHHPHRHMEIVTIVHKGELAHEDDMGNKGIIKGGEIQRMSAGEGVVHSEYNNSNEEVWLYQIWFRPDSGISKSYEQAAFQNKENSLTPLVSKYEEAPIKMNADATIFNLHLHPASEIDYMVKRGRGLFVYTREGLLDIDGQTLDPGDQVRISDEKVIKLRSLGNDPVAATVIEVKL